MSLAYACACLEVADVFELREEFAEALHEAATARGVLEALQLHDTADFGQLLRRMAGMERRLGRQEAAMLLYKQAEVRARRAPGIGGGRSTGQLTAMCSGGAATHGGR